MKTRTLLLLSVAVGMAILLAGGVFLFQLSNESATVEGRPVGGLGLSLIAGMVDRVEYAHLGGRNRLHMVIKRPRFPRPAP